MTWITAVGISQGRFARVNMDNVYALEVYRAGTYPSYTYTVMADVAIGGGGGGYQTLRVSDEFATEEEANDKLNDLILNGS
jgi:hypothetical protein